jgi:ribosome-associated protein
VPAPGQAGETSGTIQ